LAKRCCLKYGIAVFYFETWKVKIFSNNKPLNMKKILKITSPLLFFFFVILVSQCAKKKEETPPPPACKTCKATGGIDQGTIQKEVCSPEEEQAFRNANAGKTVTCN
jgi:hypothetical protein